MAKDKFDKLPPEFKDTAQAFGVEEIKANIVSLAKHTEETLKAREGDLDLEEAKARAKELGAPYSDTLKMLKLKNRFLCDLLEQKGKA